MKLAQEGWKPVLAIPASSANSAIPYRLARLIVPDSLAYKKKANIMIQYPRDMKALRQLRMEYQDSAGMAFPDSCLTEMLILHDVCKALDFTVFQVQDVLGAVAWKAVRDYINAPVGNPTEFAYQWGEIIQPDKSPSHPV